MTFIKLGEAQEIKLESMDSCLPAVSPEILENFRKFAINLKKVAPKAEDFLYFSAVMMHAAEAAALNDDGTPKLTARGETVEVGWDKSGGTYRWMSNDSSVKPYKNSNGDIFPEEELVKAYKKWVGKPLCVDHKSSSVDHVRGFIVDTYYDRNLKRVIALCALDKAGYPQLARQISTGVSSCVSMGTAVGRAICTDCARVARTEQDFCDHMRRKSCYGEINVDLNPLELSIVVNGADPKANIKHIIAAANTLNTYVENKQKELDKLADLTYSATLTVNDPQGHEGGNSTQVTVNATDLAKFKEDVEAAFQKLSEIKNSGKDTTNDTASNQELGTVIPAADSGLAPPHARYASAEVGVDPIAELHEVTRTIEAKLSQMKQSLDKLANTSTTNKQEENMSGSNETVKKGYYQGAGGVNEPTPGQAKYPKDPLQEHLREKEDKQMVGQPPFPDVGPVDGMHPSPESADQSNELERKKMLARAESEERAQRRQAIVDLAKRTIENKKTAWFQNGDGNNPGTPTPGKPKYPVDKLEYVLREHEDKQMVGQKPFPGVGPVDGLHPSPQSADTSDELKRKEMLRRAGLIARFVRASNNDGTANLGNSAWEVYLGDKLLLTASVNELSGGRAEVLHDSIATREFGGKLIEKIKTHGADKIRSLVKSGQPAPGGAPPAPGGDAGAPPAGGDAGPPAEDTGKSGDPKDQALALAEKGVELSSDLNEAVKAMVGEKSEMGDMEGGPAAAPEMGASASFSTQTLNNLRKELNGALTHAMQESIASINDHVEELNMISGLYDKGAVTDSNQEFVGSIVEDALSEAKTAIADGFKLMSAFVKYARGTTAIVKRAEIEAELEALAEGETMTGEQDANNGDDLMAMISDTNSDLDAIHGLMADDNAHAGEEPHDEALEGLLDMPADDANDLKAGDLKPETMLDPAMMSHASFDTKEGRQAMRAKLAADALGKQDDGEISDMSKQKFSDMLDQADKLTDGQTDLDTKPSDNLGYVETLPEVNKAMMDLAKAPPKVRKEAEAIHNLISEGKLHPSDLDALVAEGLDKDAVAYYKKYWAQTEGGGEFASELVKEHVKADLEAELNKYRVKLGRSYELAYDMVDRGLCHHDRNAVSAQVDEIMKFNDESFDSLKRVVARHPVTNLRKEGGRMPQVGMIGSGDLSTTPQSDGDMFAQLSAAFSKTSKRSF
jgi:hypothetical protein